LSETIDNIKLLSSHILCQLGLSPEFRLRASLIIYEVTQCVPGMYSI